MSILPAQKTHDSPAARLEPRARLRLALDALSGASVCQLALDNLVSRKFVYQQLDRAQAGLQMAFEQPDEPDGLLFWLPVTKPWLRQLVLGLVLICHSSYRGVGELLADLFDHSISIGSVHNILRQAVEQAEAINHAQDLSAVRIGALDEIFQSGKPVLAGADVRSGYCYLLSAEDRRDADTWGVRLLELQERGFAPEATVADFGTGLRAGQKQALPDTPCRADVFHPLRDFSALSTWLDSRAYDALSCHEDLSHKRRRYERRHGWKSRSLAMKAKAAGREAQKAIELADEVRTLLSWWQKDVMAVAGYEYATRQQLHDWVVEELRQREPRCGSIKAVRTLLENHTQELLAFAEQLDAELAKLSQRFGVSVALVREALAVQEMDESRPSRWQREKELWSRLGGKYAPLRVEVEELAGGVVRASSVIENLNSRLRNYFFLRKQLGRGGYLKLLQFYLNHRRSLRSEHPERAGKSPAELLSGQEHAHWLELLGYRRFSQSQAA
jgi:hypothetical protein